MEYFPVWPFLVINFVDLYACQVTLDISGNPTDFSGAPGNIQGNLIGMRLL